MAISLIKEFKQKQKVSLTPQLKKSIDLLQLSRYELIQKIDNEIESNPFIEKEDFDDFEFKANPDDFDFEISASESLRQNLINQIEDLGLDENSRRIALLIIDSIDESGQLHDGLDELEAMMNYQFNFYDIEVVLKNIIHNLEPAGIGYRNFKECIKIQISKKKLSQNIKAIVDRILNQNKSDDLESIRNNLISSGFEKNKIDSAINEIKSCDLSPGLNYEETNFVIPDIKIRLEKSHLYTDFVTDNFPKIKIDEELLKKVNTELKRNPNKELLEKNTKCSMACFICKKKE